MRPRVGRDSRARMEKSILRPGFFEVPFVSQPVGRVPQRRNARSNRARILATARRELGRNPDITLEELARAAGVVRRTLFGHFPGRSALLEALAEEASKTFEEVLADAQAPAGP